MFNYIKDVIINDVTNNVVKVDDTLVIKRGANYKFDNIIDKKVYKTAGVSGTCAVVTVPFVAPTTVSADYRQYAFFISTPSQQLSDYAYANWHEFGKTILIESAATSKEDLAEAFKLALQPGNELYTVSISGTDILLTFKESWMKVEEVTILNHLTADGSLAPETNASYKATISTENVEEFATAKWLVENLRFPSYPNLRYNRLYADEAPVAGTVYDQYSFQYGVKHYIEGGLSGVGQNVDSITTHVFYVPHASAGTFEGKFASDISFVTTTSAVSSMDVNANSAAGAGSSAADDVLSSIQTATAGAADFAAFQTAIAAL